VEEFLENGIKNTFSITRGKFLSLLRNYQRFRTSSVPFLRVHQVSGHLNFGKISLSKAYVRYGDMEKKYREDRQ
jgi:hypothetical protein